MGLVDFSVEAYIYWKIFLSSAVILQLESLSVPFISVEDLPLDLSKDFDIVVDAMFGFSFRGNYYFSSFLVNLFLFPMYIVKGRWYKYSYSPWTVVHVYTKCEHEKTILYSLVEIFKQLNNGCIALVYLCIRIISALLFLQYTVFFVIANHKLCQFA